MKNQEIELRERFQDEEITETEGNILGHSFDNKNTEKKIYRTRSKATDVISMPERYVTITNKDYQNAIGLCQNGKAYLQPIDANKLEIDKDKRQIYFKGLPLSMASLKELSSNSVLQKINLPLLRAFYSIALNQYESDMAPNVQEFSVITLYFPDLLRFIGINKDNRDQRLAIIHSIASFDSIIGIIDGDLLRVLVYIGESQENNTISFCCPYINRVIKKIYDISRTSDTYKTQSKRGYHQERKAVYSYLIKPNIVKERNKKAIEIVDIVVKVIEQTGSNKGKIPHLSAKNIVERNILLKESLEHLTTTDKNKVLKQAFRKAWELLRSHTYLQEKYVDILLPDPEDNDNLPTVSKLSTKVFIFSHNGKR